MYGRILLPTDGSETSARGLDHGLALARALNCPVTLLTVTDPLPSYTGLHPGMFALPDSIGPEWQARQARAAADILGAAAARAAAAGVTADTLHIPDARPAEAILKAADDLGVGLIVMASHGRRGLERVLLGSQVAEVVNHAKVPVQVVR